MYYTNKNLNQEKLSESLQIRNFLRKDAKETADVMKRSLLETTQDVCLLESIESLAQNCNSDRILEIDSYSRIYVVCINKKIVACGIISKNFEEKSILLTSFVSSELQGYGFSRKIIEHLERDEYYLNARKIQITTSLAACKFYKKMESALKKELQDVSA